MNKLLSTLLLALLTSCGSTPHRAETVRAVPMSINLALTDMEGEALDLGADLGAGRPVVLVFWQTWCGSCRAEAPEIVKASKRFAQRARFVGVVPGPDELVDDTEVRAVARDWNLPYRQVRDRDNALTSGLSIEGTPTIVVIGPDRAIRYRGHRLPGDWESLLQ